MLFPTSETLRRMSTSFGLSDIWDRAFEWTSDSYGYEWLLVFKAAISQSEVTLVNLNGPRNLCAESSCPFSLWCSGEGNYVYYARKILCVQCLSVNSEIGSKFFPKVLLSLLRFTCFFVCSSLRIGQYFQNEFSVERYILAMLLLLTNLIRQIRTPL